MRLLTLLVSAVFVACGVGLTLAGEPFGLLVAGFFGLCLLVALFERRLPQPHAASDYRLLVTNDEVACEHPQRQRESIRWDAVTRIWFVTTSDGPWLPDHWILLEGEHGGCSFPTDARGFDDIWDELKQRFAGFDYGPLIRGGTDEAKHLCWERPGLTSDRA